MHEHLHQGQASVMLSSSSSSDVQNVGGNGTGCRPLRMSPEACRCDSLDMQYLHDAFTCLVYLTRLHTALETDRNSFTFSFSAPKMTIHGSFGYFRFRPQICPKYRNSNEVNEQLFSAAGQIYSDRRSNLLGENAEKTAVSVLQHSSL